MAYTVIIPAAGQGKRMNAGGNKQFLNIRSLPLIIRTLRIFQNDEACTAIVVVVNAGEIGDMERLFTHYNVSKVQALVPGGKERQESVYAGLQHLDQAGIVLVHDGARPFIRQEEIHRLLAEVSDTQGAVLATKVKDTIKKGSDEQFVTETLTRDELWSVQTPQAFSFDMLKKAHEVALNTGFTGTDDASLVEYISGKIRLVPGSEDNIKLTTPDDIGMAEMILGKRKGDEHEDWARL
ncbi:2-C-methyl-D-erythritol 4-phosphate cytidylyltransferase [Natribacillus halophilus]|uniref:2-C-methyl-D-erythritol 4-phosphate cytidylyltransferase n=1 Tax=Natribacillus halophilus TaxID=549003 RepID=A0A1G8QY76_9BACI|nr:2-C-methyl-D-erythritol 4-phosphate cytidylyltransferase [Natribacillus halophilus]SDJ09637.1 2-C-methyl-D-erythritol 4-phosphate cytidylyltransferase [Natribacillus halophilus]